ncbi:apolipoprotein N-acyltransferase [Paracoccus sp. (in: a-proteobacteria)]|uniref:apolipoprotein N-acyltransferase n=1 Tax=Paracoccus sp. TaxID=267 RepID=UPI003A889F15
MFARMRDRLMPPRLGWHARPAPRHLGIDLLLGAVAALGLAPFGVWGATVAALAVLIWRFARARPATAFWHALAAGIGWFGLALVWIVEPFLVEPEIYGWMAPFALILMAIGGALFWALPVWAAARICPGWRSRSAGITAALVLSDWLRGWIFTGFPWALIGHVWIDTPVAQTAAWTGAPGLSAITLTAAALPALLWRQVRQTALGFAGGIVLCLLLTGMIWAVGVARQAAPLPPDTALRLRIVQPDAEQRLKWDPEWSAIFFGRLLDLSAAPGQRDLVIWPETAVNFLLNDAGEVLPAMSQAADAPLLLGIQRQEGGVYHNALAAIAPGGTLMATYDKFHLVPFGEYIPWGAELARFGITAFAAQSGAGYAPGPGARAISLPGLPAFQPLICYEAIFPQHLRGLDQRPGWLLQITNDGWFGKFSGPYQHLAQARLRAIESGLPLIRAANTGISAVIDAHGAVRQTLSLGEIGKIDTTLPAALPETFWIRHGPAPVILLALLALAAAAGTPRLAGMRQQD